MQIEALAAKYPDSKAEFMSPLEFFTKIHQMLPYGQAYFPPELGIAVIKTDTGFCEIPVQEAQLMQETGFGYIQAQRHLEQHRRLFGH